MDNTILTRLVVFTYVIMLLFIFAIASAGIYKWVTTPNPTQPVPVLTDKAQVANT